MSAKNRRWNHRWSRQVRLIIPVALASILVFYTSCGGDHQDFVESSPSTPQGAGPQDPSSAPGAASYTIKVLEGGEEDSAASLSSVSYPENNVRTLKCRLLQASELVPSALCHWRIVTVAGLEVWSASDRDEVTLPSLASDLYHLWVSGPREMGELQTRVILTVTSASTGEPTMPVFMVSIEDRADGLGTKLTSKTFTFGSSHTFYAVARDASGAFLQLVQGSWAMEGELGVLAVLANGTQATFSSEYPGKGILRMTYSDRPVAQTQIEVEPPKLIGTQLTRVLGVGPRTGLDESVYYKADGSTTTNLAESDQSIVVEWQADPGLAREAWGVFKSDSPGVFDLSSPLASPWLELPASATSFRDTSGVPGRFVYYLILPKQGGYSLARKPLPEVRVVAPPANRVFISRATVNSQMCRFMLKHASVEPLQHNRCPYDGVGNLGGYYDIGADFLVDRFEAGVNVSASGVTVESDGGIPLYKWNGSELGNLSVEQLLGKVAYAAQIPPLNATSQVQAFGLCRARAVTLRVSSDAQRTYAMRLPRMAEWRAFSMWPSSWTPSDINAMERGGQGRCNGDYGHASESNRPVEPFGSSLGRLMPTGSIWATRACVSDSGLQDAVGNVREWVSDQCDWDLWTPPYTCRTPQSPLDSSRWMLNGVALGGEMNGVTFDSALHLLPAHGFPINETRAGVVKMPQYRERFQQERIELRFGLSGAMLGGGYVGPGVGESVWASPWSTMAGFRCVAELEP
ncbi:MAG: hypothetical protein NDI61_10905 [Bdellovibrionaceae bacterium]|nr:hypothetical protein [Pseudobdellovibrionaceae bacterium]